MSIQGRKWEAMREKLEFAGDGRVRTAIDGDCVYTVTRTPAAETYDGSGERWDLEIHREANLIAGVGLQRDLSGQELERVAQEYAALPDHFESSQARLQVALTAVRAREGWM